MRALRTSIPGAIALALPLFAQEPATRPTPTTAAAPALVLTTSDAAIAHVVAEALGCLDDLPEAPVESHYRLSFGADRKCAVSTAKGEVGLLQVTADPGALMDLFAEQIDAATPMFRGALTVGLQQSGMPAKDAATLVKDLLEFPRQLQTVALKVTGDPTSIAADGFDVTLDIEGKAGSAFASTVDALGPSSQGVPQLPDEGALATLRMSLAPKGLRALLQPLRTFSVGATARTAEQRQRAGDLYDRWLALYDGGMGMTFEQPFRAKMLMGVLDAGKLRELMASEDYRTMAREQQLPNRDLEIKVQFDAFEYRGIKFTASTIEGGEPNALMPDGALVTRLASVGDFVAMTMGGTEADTKALADAVLDQKIGRAPLAGGALMVLEMDLRRLARIVGPGIGMGGEPGEQMPSKMTLQIGRHGAGLRLQLHLK